MTVKAPGYATKPGALWRGRGDSTLPYTASFRSTTELTWGIKMGARQNNRPTYSLTRGYLLF